MVSTMVMICGLIAVAMPITVLGSNFQMQYDKHKAIEKQQKKDIFAAIRIGLTEYRAALETEYEKSERQEERILLKLIDTELFKVAIAADELRDHNQSRMELEQNTLKNRQSLASLETEITDIKNALGVLMRANGTLPPSALALRDTPLVKFRRDSALEDVSYPIAIAPNQDQGQLENVTDNPNDASVSGNENMDGPVEDELDIAANARIFV
jgi:hypothetical protein